jgi:hypothetical protein
VDYGVLDGRPFAVYGFEEGVFLAQIIEGLKERGRRLPSGVAVGIIYRRVTWFGGCTSSAWTRKTRAVLFMVRFARAISC